MNVSGDDLSADDVSCASRGALVYMTMSQKERELCKIGMASRVRQLDGAQLDASLLKYFEQFVKGSLVYVQVRRRPRAAEAPSLNLYPVPSPGIARRGDAAGRPRSRAEQLVIVILCPGQRGRDSCEAAGRVRPLCDGGCLQWWQDLLWGMQLARCCFHLS